MALGGNYEARSLGLKKPDGIRNEVRIETIALENGEVRASTMEYSLFDRLTIASSGNRKNSNLPGESLLQAVAGLKGIVRRSVLHEDDLSRNNTRQKVLDKGSDEGPQI